MRFFAVFAVLILLTSCSMINVPVPPESFSLETVLKLPSARYDLSSVNDIDSFEGVEVKGKAAVYGRLVFYGFKFEDPSQTRKVFKKLISKRLLKLRLLDLPWMGSFEESSKMEKLLVWWKGPWLFALEGEPEYVEEFYRSIGDIFRELRD